MFGAFRNSSLSSGTKVPILYRLRVADIYTLASLAEQETTPEVAGLWGFEATRGPGSALVVGLQEPHGKAQPPNILIGVELQGTHGAQWNHLEKFG